MFSRLFYPIDWTLSCLASVLRLGAGKPGISASPPTSPLILYEFESCPFCRIAREQVSASGVSVQVKPCPKGGMRYRPEVVEKGGKAQFPYLIDPNVSAEGHPADMYESADIAHYLREQYGHAARPPIHWAGPVNHILSQFATVVRYLSGTIARPATAPEQPLLLYTSERSPGGRLVKELLCSKELEYVWSPRSPDGLRTPTLKDPNADRTVTGGFAILHYLRRTYPSM
ncbi:MAG: glutathione S-transferase N-terminal domain-containing protein [Henriciella sp.]